MVHSDPATMELVDSTAALPVKNTCLQQDHHIQNPEDVWVPTGRRLISGFLGLNLVLLGAALVSAQSFNPEGLTHQEPQVFMLILMVLSLIWMLWYLLWARKQPGISPHQDHHAGGITAILVLVLFCGFSVLLFLCRLGYLISLRECRPAVEILSTFIEAPFLLLQTYLLWAHSKDCIHKHKIITRSGLMVVLSADLLLWFNAVTEDSIHLEIELEKEDRLSLHYSNVTREEDYDDTLTTGNSSLCRCSASATCLAFRKGFEVLYPFSMEFYLMSGCMIYVMWKNVGRRTGPGHHAAQKLTLSLMYHSGVVYGLVFGVLVFAAGLTIFILYQIWVTQQKLRLHAFLLFYGYHVVLVPVMAACSLTGVLVHRLERHEHEGDHNPTRSLDVVLLVLAALGQLGLSYFSVVAALAVKAGGGRGVLENLDLSYSLLTVVELLLQNIFIIQGLHRNPHVLQKRRKRKMSSIFKRKAAAVQEDSPQEGDTSALPAGQVHDGKKSWHQRVIKEICVFLILSNIMLWIIPAFGAHPQLENGAGRWFFGFRTWLVLVNLGQPLSVFYRMHSVGALMELLLSEA